MKVLPYFLPGALPATRPVDETTSPHGRPYFLFVGRLARIKGLHTVLPRFASYPEADLLVIGDGEDEAMLRQMAAGAPNITFLGRVANEALTRYYAHAMALICPSVGYETFGIVLIEALRAGTPVIARRIGPFPEIVEQSGGGLLYDRDEDLPACLSRLQSDPALRADLAERGYRACRERWSEAVVVDRFLQYISDLR